MSNGREFQRTDAATGNERENMYDMTQYAYTSHAHKHQLLKNVTKARKTTQYKKFQKDTVKALKRVRYKQYM